MASLLHVQPGPPPVRPLRPGDHTSVADTTGGRPALLALALAGAGATPVTLVAASTFGVRLRSVALVAGLPAVIVVVVAVARSRPAATLARSALAIGLVGTAVYDVTRIGFLLAGVVDRDPIPHIGVELGLDPPAVYGYLWRYLGNGTGLALAFLALGLRGTRAGVGYGLAVCAGLLATLAVSPHGQQLLFPLTPGTVVMATTGHVVFGAVLGSLSARHVPASSSSCGGATPSPVLALPAGRPSGGVDEIASPFPVGVAS